MFIQELIGKQGCGEWGTVMGVIDVGLWRFFFFQFPRCLQFLAGIRIEIRCALVAKVEVKSLVRKAFQKSILSST